MTRAKDIAEQFEKELKEFLKKWNTEIEVEDIGKDWSSDHVMKCYIDAVYVDGEVVSEFTIVDLGRYVAPD
jgi:hypothetical protein